jgi:hypothetical protein
LRLSSVASNADVSKTGLHLSLVQCLFFQYNCETIDHAGISAMILDTDHTQVIIGDTKGFIKVIFSESVFLTCNNPMKKLSMFPPP